MIGTGFPDTADLRVTPGVPPLPWGTAPGGHREVAAPRTQVNAMSPDAWLRGPVDGVIPELQPVAHSLIQAQEDLERIVPMIPGESLWKAPGGAASPGFHLHHLAGSTDRLLSYARGAPLDDGQRRHLGAEKEPHPEKAAEDLLAALREVFHRTLEHLRTVEAPELDDDRSVGSGGLPSNVRGLLYHIAEHATRHVGQLITTLNVLGDRPVPGAETTPHRHAPPGGILLSPGGREAER